MALTESQTKIPAETVIAAQKGDKFAQTELYEKCYNSVYYIIKTIVKSEDLTLDLVQDTFLKAFANLDKLSNPAAFLPWVKRIGSNVAKNYLRKKKPTLFSEMLPNDDSGDNDEVVDFADMDLTSQPEEALDAKTKKQLLWAIIDELSDEQRIVVNLFYFQNCPVADIAQSLGVSPNTVKSRLNYARKKIEAKVLDLEKKGTKLYGLAPIPFFIWLFLQNEKFNPATAIPIAGTAAGAAGQAAKQAVGKTAKTAATKAGSSAAKGVAVKVVAGVAAVGVIGGAGYGVYHLTNQKPYSWYQEPYIAAQDINILFQGVSDATSDTSVNTGMYLQQYPGDAFYIKTDNGVGIITLEDGMIVPDKYDTVSVQENFTIVLASDEGTFTVSVPDGALTPYVKSLVQAKYEASYQDWTITNYDGRAAGVYLPQEPNGYSSTPYKEAGAFQDNMFPVESFDSLWGYVSLSGDTIIPIEYLPSWYVDTSIINIENTELERRVPGHNVYYQLEESDNWMSGPATFQTERAYSASDGYIVLRNEDGYGLVDTEGNEIIPFGEFYQLRPVYNGKLFAQKDEGGEWGVLQLDKSPANQ